MQIQARPTQTSMSTIEGNLLNQVEDVKIAPYDIKQYDEFINAFYRENTRLCVMPLLDRVEQVSQRFLGRPYEGCPLGEGPCGHFDQAPLYRFDKFDCVTFVNLVLALALSNSLYMFQKNLCKLGYKRGDLYYQNRHHFMSADWNIYNQEAGLVRDITKSCMGRSIEIAYAEATIDRPSWFRCREFKHLRLLEAWDREDIERRLDEMRSLSKVVEVTRIRQPYIPLNELFSAAGTPKLDLFSRIPHGAIMEMVRPNWDLCHVLGTCINVSHVGLVIHKNGVPYLRHASSIYKSVVDTLLVDYLQVRVDSPTIKGIHLQELI